MNIYALKDVKAERFISITISESDDTFVRNSLFSILMDYPIKDVEFYCIGQFDPDLGLIKPCVPRLGNWECYKFAQTTMSRDKFLSIEEIEEAAKNKKHEFIKKQKSEIPQYEKMLSELKGRLNLEESRKEKDKDLIKKLKVNIKDVSHTLVQLKSIKEV